MKILHASCFSRYGFGESFALRSAKSPTHHQLVGFIAKLTFSESSDAEEWPCHGLGLKWWGVQMHPKLWPALTGLVPCNKLQLAGTEQTMHYTVGYYKKMATALNTKHYLCLVGG